MQSIQLAEKEYINAFGVNSWRQTVHSSVTQNSDYVNEAPPEDPAQPTDQPRQLGTAGDPESDTVVSPK